MLANRPPRVHYPGVRPEDLLRETAPRVLGVLVRRYGDFAGCEDAVQEALLAAALQWPADGVPANPAGWLITVAAHRWVEQWRSETARRRREDTAVGLEPPAPVPGADDTFTCCCCAATPRSPRPPRWR